MVIYFKYIELFRPIQKEGRTDGKTWYSKYKYPYLSLNNMQNKNPLEISGSFLFLLLSPTKANSLYEFE